MNTESAYPSRRWRMMLVVPAAGLMLSACAVTKVQNLATASSVRAMTPSDIRVDVALAPEIRSEPAAQKAAFALEDRLVRHYQKAGIRAYTASNGRASSGTARLRVLVHRADPGNKFQRFAVGFGMGRSALHTEVSLEAPGTRGPAMYFSSLANSGRRPGMILPGGIAAATGKTSTLAISAGVGLLSVRSGLNSDADRSARRIVKETRTYYQSVGWHWPQA